MRERGERSLGVDEQLRDAVVFGDRLLGVRTEVDAKGVDVLFVDREAGRRLVAAVRHQMLAAGGERFVQIEARHAAAGADARLHAQRIERDQNHRAVVLLGEPPGDDADHARDASRGRRARSRRAAGRGVESPSCLLAALRTLRSSVCRWSLSSWTNSASCIARCGDSVVEQLDRQLGLPQPAGRVEPRADREGDVFAGERRLLVEARHVLERLEARHRAVPQAIQPVPHQHAILVHQRHDVGHRADRGEPDGPHQIIPHRLADALRFARPLAQRPGELQRDGRAAQTGERIRRRPATPDARSPRRAAAVRPADDDR